MDTSDPVSMLPNFGLRPSKRDSTPRQTFSQLKVLDGERKRQLPKTFANIKVKSLDLGASNFIPILHKDINSPSEEVENKYIFGISAAFLGVLNHAPYNRPKEIISWITRNQQKILDVYKIQHTRIGSAQKICDLMEGLSLTDDIKISQLELFSGTVVTVKGLSLNDYAIYCFIHLLDIYQHGVENRWQLENERRKKAGKRRKRTDFNRRIIDPKDKSGNQDRIIHIYDLVEELVVKRASNGESEVEYYSQALANIIIFANIFMNVQTPSKSVSGMYETRIANLPLLQLKMDQSDIELFSNLLADVAMFNETNEDRKKQDGRARSLRSVLKSSNIFVDLNAGAIHEIQKNVVGCERSVFDPTIVKKRGYQENNFDILLPGRITDVPTVRGDAVANCFCLYKSDSNHERKFALETIARLIGRSAELSSDHRGRFNQRLAQIFKAYAYSLEVDGYNIYTLYFRRTRKKFIQADACSYKNLIKSSIYTNSPVTGGENSTNSPVTGGENSTNSPVTGGDVGHDPCRDAVSGLPRKLVKEVDKEFKYLKEADAESPKNFSESDLFDLRETLKTQFLSHIASNNAAYLANETGQSAIVTLFKAKSLESLKKNTEAYYVGFKLFRQFACEIAN